jgi:hypothetical protein
LGLGAAARVACCTIPLLGPSIGAGGLGAFVALGEPIALGLAGVGVALVALRRRSEKRQGSCAETGACSSDGACGSRPPDTRTQDRHAPAIVCTLPGEQMSFKINTTLLVAFGGVLGLAIHRAGLAG